MIAMETTMTTGSNILVRVAMDLSHYDIDNFNTIMTKITRLVEEAGLSIEEAHSMLEEHYKNVKKENS